jgi:predicted phage terminase large subunit-like protein
MLEDKYIKAKPPKRTLSQMQNSLMEAATLKPASVNPLELLRLETLTSFEKYTKAMFKVQYKRTFIVAEHHKKIFQSLQDVVDGKCKRLIINMPPRYGKTETAIKSFISWCFALNPKCRFLHLSYSDMLVNDNSDTIRSIMKEDLYKQLFPKSALESDKASAKRWKTKAGGELYAVSTQGQVTGFGAGNVDEIDPYEKLGANTADNLTFDDGLNEMLDIIGAKENVFQGAILIDDPMKPEDADSDIIRERINLRFENTIRNRTNSRNTPIIIIMQRLHEHDLCGYLQEVEPEEWTVLSLPAIQNNEAGEEYALWPMKHTLEELHKMREINPLVFDTQYMQDPTPREGLMYADGFRTYTREMLPIGHNAVHKWNYTDTADTGADHLCSICFIDTPEYVYVTDVLFTDAPMEKTETQTSDMLTRNQTTVALIESNNGGRSFARNIKRILRVVFRNFRITVSSFTQTSNKVSRIYSNSGCCMNDILFPEGWEKKWPKFHSALMSYRKDNKKKQQHDDAPDCLTGVYEMHSRKNRNHKIKMRNG